MKTTIRIDDGLLQRASLEAERRGVTLASLVEQGLQLMLRPPNKNLAQRILNAPHTSRDAIRADVDFNDGANVEAPINPAD